MACRVNTVSLRSVSPIFIERLNNTLRQRCSRLVRKALFFSKKLRNHIEAIGSFIHDYNARICARLGLNTPPA